MDIQLISTVAVAVGTSIGLALTRHPKFRKGLTPGGRHKQVMKLLEERADWVGEGDIVETLAGNKVFVLTSLNNLVAAGDVEKVDDPTWPEPKFRVRTKAN